MIDQGTDEWKLLRLGNVTGSRTYDIIKGSRLASWKNYKAELLVERLTGTPTESFTNKSMMWGTEMEPLARLKYQLLTKNRTEQYSFVKDPERDFGASPDDGIVGQNGGVEYKNPNTATHVNTLQTKKVPPIYFAQVQAQMHVMEWDFVDYVSHDARIPGAASMIIIRVDRDDTYIAEMLIAVDSFLEELEKDILFIQNYGKETN